MSCPHLGPIARPENVEPRSVPLVDAPIGAKVHVGRIPDRVEAIDRLFDQLERKGLVRGLTVTVSNRCHDGAVCVRTGRGELWVDPAVAARLLVTVGDLNIIADQLRGVSTIGPAP